VPHLSRNVCDQKKPRVVPQSRKRRFVVRKKLWPRARPEVDHRVWCWKVEWIREKKGKVTRFGTENAERVLLVRVVRERRTCASGSGVDSNRTREHRTRR
jgi:hypothetical protein